MDVRFLIESRQRLRSVICTAVSGMEDEIRDNRKDMEAGMSLRCSEDIFFERACPERKWLRIGCEALVLVVIRQCCIFQAFADDSWYDYKENTLDNNATWRGEPVPTCFFGCF